MTQAQADLEHLRTAKIEVVRKGPEPPAIPLNQNSEGSVKGKEKEVDSSPAMTSSAVLTQSANAFFNRLTSSTSQLQQSLQSTFQSTLASASSNPALTNPAQLRAQLAENLRLSSATENLQLSIKQAEKLAEEYLRKGDQWVKDAEKWVGDAVKVMPPEGEEIRNVGMSWDGSDWYSFSTSPATSSSKEYGNNDAESRLPGSSKPGAILAGSRKEALLRRLREDKELLMVDPAGEEESAQRKEEFRRWVADDWDTSSKESREAEEGLVGAIRMALGKQPSLRAFIALADDTCPVPEYLTDEQFWQRYLFHKHMIEAEEEKRKMFLAGTAVHRKQ